MRREAITLVFAMMICTVLTAACDERTRQWQGVQLAASLTCVPEPEQGTQLRCGGYTGVTSSR